MGSSQHREKTRGAIQTCVRTVTMRVLYMLSRISYLIRFSLPPLYHVCAFRLGPCFQPSDMRGIDAPDQLVLEKRRTTLVSGPHACEPRIIGKGFNRIPRHIRKKSKKIEVRERERERSRKRERHESFFLLTSMFPQTYCTTSLIPPLRLPMFLIRILLHTV